MKKILIVSAIVMLFGSLKMPPKECNPVMELKFMRNGKVLKTLTFESYESWKGAVHNDWVIEGKVYSPDIIEVSIK